MAPTHRLLGPALLVLAVAGLTLAAVPLAGARTAAAPPVRLEVLGQVGGTAYDVVVDGDVAYLLQGPRVLAVDLSDPAAPRELGQSEVLGGIAEAGAVYRDHLYVCLRVTDSRGALAVLNVAEPARPLTIGTLELAGLAQDVAVAGGVAYVAVASPDLTGALATVDVTDPAKPRALAALALQEPSEALAVSGQRAYVLGGDHQRGSLRVIDVTDPAAPRRVASLPLTPAGRPPRRTIALSGGHLLVPLDTGAVRMFSLSEPDLPHPVTDLGDSQGIRGVHQMAASTDGWVATTSSVSLTAGRLAELLDGRPAAVTADWPSAIGAAWHGADLVVSGADFGGLGVFQAQDAQLVRRSALGQMGGVDNIARHGDSAYVTLTANHTLARVDLSDPARPRLADRYPHTWNTGTLAVRGDTLFGGNLEWKGRGNVLSAYALAPDGSPRESDWLEVSTSRFLLHGERVYIGSSGHLHTVDITDPAALRVTGTIVDPTGFGSYLAASGDRLYSASGDSLHAIDIAQPDRAQVLGATGTHLFVAGLAARGDRALLSTSGAVLFPDEFRGLVVFDAREPARIHQVGSLALPVDVWPGPVLVDGDRAYLASSDGLRALDVTADQPAPMDWLPLAGQATSLDQRGDLLAAGRGDGGLVLVRIVPAEVPTATPSPTVQPPPTRTTSPAPSATAPTQRHAAYLPHVVRTESTAGPVELGEAYELDGLSWDLAVDGDLVYGGLGPHVATWRLGDTGFTMLGRSPRLGGDVYGIELSGQRLYVAASGGGLAVLDVQRPSAPVLLGTVRLPAPAVDVTVIGTTAYVAAGDAGLQAVDVADPRRPRVIGAFDGPRSPRAVVAIGDRTVYVLDSRWRYDLGQLEGRLWVVDVTDPAHLSEATHVDVVGWSLALGGGWLYVCGQPEIARIDVSRPRSPGTPQPLGIWAYGFAVRGDRMWSIVPGIGIQAWDLAAPQMALGELDVGPIPSVGGVAMAGDRLLWAMPSERVIELPGRSGRPSMGLGAAEVSDPAAMRLLGRTGPVALTDYDCTPYLGEALCNDDPAVLRRVGIAESAASTTIGRYAMPPTGFGGNPLASRGEILFAYSTPPDGGATAPRQSDHQFRVLRPHEPDQVEVIGAVAVPRGPVLDKLVVDGDTVFGLTSPAGGILAFDVADLSQPRLLGEAPQVPRLTNLAASGGIGLGTVASGLVVLDLSAPPDTPLLSWPSLPFTPGGVLLVDDGHRGYTAGHGGLAILDLADPHHPVVLGSAPERFMPGAMLRLHGHHLYVAGQGVAVYDVSDPAAPHRVATWRTPDGDTPPDYPYFLSGLWPTENAIYATVRDNDNETDTTVALYPPP